MLHLRRALAASALLAVVGCRSGARPPASSSTPRPAPGPNYSSVPCAETCGRDAQCAAGCTPLSNQQPLPPNLGR